MSDLYKKKCVACDGSIPAFEISEIHKYLKKIDGWHVKENEEKIFIFLKNLNSKILKKAKIL